MNFVMMPMWLFSGVFFSYENFPQMFHPFMRLLPLTALNDSLRALMLEGDVLTSLAPEMAVMAIWTVVAFFLALRVFRWQ
jgi:ABC-type polysaccharide/polyol phosphate export permease